MAWVFQRSTHASERRSSRAFCASAAQLVVAIQTCGLNNDGSLRPLPPLPPSPLLVRCGVVAFRAWPVFGCLIEWLVSVGCHARDLVFVFVVHLRLLP